MFLDVMVGIFLLAVVALVYSATIGAAVVSRAKADERTKASAIINRHIESCRNLGYGNLNYSSLVYYNLIDSTPTSAPYSFTNAGPTASDRVSAILRDGQGTINITDPTTTIRRITVTVTWTSRTGSQTASASTEIAKLK